MSEVKGRQGDVAFETFGLRWEEVLDRIGTIDQIASATPISLTEGSALGVRALDVRTISGLSATVLVDRGMDIAQATYQGTPLAWVSPTGPVHSAFAAAGDWRSSFHGGLLATCGTQNVGTACEVDGVRYPEHGALSNIPAREVRWSIDSSSPAIIVEGCVREVQVLGVDIELRRSLRFDVLRPRLCIEDTFTNHDHMPAPLMLLYHMNLGWPVVDQGSRLFGWPSRVAALKGDSTSEAALGESEVFCPPTPGWPAQVFQHIGEEAQGPRTVGVFNPDYPPLRGLAVGVSYQPSQLPFLWRWRMFGRRTYLMGLEPSTSPGANREEAMRRDLPVVMLGSGATHQVDLTLTVGVAEAAELMASGG